MGKRLHQELQDLRSGVLAMAAMVEQSLQAAVATLLKADADAAEQVRQGDTAINDRRFALENETVNILVTQQPVATDLRLLVGVLEITSELERMGDYSKDIARVAIRQAEPGVPQVLGIEEMARLATDMLSQAVTAFDQGDAELATKAAREDNTVNQQCAALHRQLVQDAHADPDALEEALRILPAIHNIERFADRVTNICERTVYIITAEQVEFGDRE